MSATLSPTGKLEIEGSDRGQINNEFSKLSSNFSNSSWLNSTNKLHKNTIENISNQQFSNDEMKEYIAASAITHLNDAWTFMGRAIHAILNNDTITARHLAYYAELRAAMSILATEGIGLFNNRHYCIDSSGNAKLISKNLDENGNPKHLGTHQMVWVTLEYWSSLDKATNLITKILKPNDIGLDIWMQNYGVTSLNSLTSKLFKNLGIDLKLLADDRDIRNRVSYRPSAIHINQSASYKENYNFIIKLWKLLEPSFAGGFPQIDRLLLKQTINLLADSNIQQKSPLNLFKLLKSTIGDKTLRREYYKFFRNKDTNELITYATKTYNNIELALDDDKNHLQVISRAVLLLRVATGSSNLMLKDASISFDDLSFWWKKLIIDNGLCALDDEMEVLDLWQDIKDFGIDEIEGKIEHQESFYDLKKETSYPSILLGECDRALLWGISS